MLNPEGISEYNCLNRNVKSSQSRVFGKTYFCFPFTMKSEILADKKQCEMKQSNDRVLCDLLCDLIPDSLQLNPQKHLPKTLICHGDRVGISLHSFKSVPCPQPEHPHKDENSRNFHRLAGVCCGMMESAPALLQVTSVAGTSAQASAGANAEWVQKVCQGNRGNTTSGSCFCVKSNLTKSWPLKETI